MKKIAVLSCVFILLASSYVFAERPIGTQEFTSIDELAGAVAAYFPKAQGEVKAVDNSKLTITLDRKDGLTPGMELGLWREGREILHPVTGAVIGRQEEHLGTIEVISVGDASSVAIVRKSLKEPRQGDTVRITPRKIKLGIIPLRPDRPDIVQELSERLVDYGRFTIPDQVKTAEYLKDRKQLDTGLVKDMGRQFSLDAVIALGIYPMEGKYLITARIFYTDEAASTLDTIIATVDLKSRKDALGEIQPFFVPSKEEKSIAPELPFQARFVSCSDFEGDGSLEYAFSDGALIHIYRDEPSGWREVWTETARTERQGIVHINIDAADINGNGKAELFVTAMLNGSVFSYVLEFRDGMYKQIADVTAFLRVLAYPGKGLQLLGQAYDPAAFYSGEPALYTWSGGKYTGGRAFPLPKGVTLYGFTVARFAESQPLLVGFDEEDHLLVFSGGTPLWRSEERYSAVDTYIYKPVTGIGAVLAKEARENEKSQRVRIPGRVMAIDADADGKDEIIVPKNLAGSYLGEYKEAELKSLTWTGARLEQRWSVNDIPGAVLDFQVMHQETAGSRIIALVRNNGGIFSKDRIRTMSYSVK